MVLDKGSNIQQILTDDKKRKLLNNRQAFIKFQWQCLDFGLKFCCAQPCFSCVFINECNKIIASSYGWCLHWSTNMRVHNFKWCTFSIRLSNSKGLSMLLAKMSSSQILSHLLINVSPFSIIFMCSSFSPQKLLCPNMKHHIED